jgi:transposase
MMVWTHSASLFGLAMGHNEVSASLKETEWIEMKHTTIGLDIAKNVFHMVELSNTSKIITKKELKRRQVLNFFSNLQPTRVVMESCSSSNYWARQFQRFGHQAKLIAPKYVKPYLKGNKNDYNDAEAIAEAAQRANMRFVPIKCTEQQDVQSLHRQRERIKHNRQALVNQIRGLLAEYGIVIVRGMSVARCELPGILEDADNGLSVQTRDLFAELYSELLDLDRRMLRCERVIKTVNKNNEICQRLDEVLGIGEITATATYAAIGNGSEFHNGRHFSAWLGMVPGQASSGGKQKLLGISKRGNTYLRTCYIHGARSVLAASAGKSDRFSLWAQALLERRGHNKACVAVANKLARMAWVVARGESYNPAM